MTFKRSASGLLSLHIFFNVDIVVYCEGGPSLSYQAAVAPQNNDGTLDSLFWSHIVTQHGHANRYHFKSVGSKSILKEIAEDIAVHNINTISVCFDQDYDWYLGGRLSHNRVAYTFGYSWENDVVQYPVLAAMLINFVGPGIQSTQATQDLLNELNRFSNDLVRWIEIDISLRAKNKKCLFDRERPLSSIDMSSCARLRIPALTQRLGDLGYKRGPKRVVHLTNTDSLRVCFGKMIGKAIYHAFMQVIQTYLPSFRMEYDVFMRVAISETIKAAATGNLPSFATHVAAGRAAFA